MDSLSEGSLLDRHQYQSHLGGPKSRPYLWLTIVDMFNSSARIETHVSDSNGNDKTTTTARPYTQQASTELAPLKWPGSGSDTRHSTW